MKVNELGFVNLKKKQSSKAPYGLSDSLLQTGLDT